MLEVTIPGKGEYGFETLVLDVNGTITFDGKLIDGVRERLETLQEVLEIFIVTADTLGTARQLRENLGIRVKTIVPGDEKIQKLWFVRETGPGSTIAIGNGSNDSHMLREAALGIAILGGEGASSETIQNADIVVTDINAALDLLLRPKRLIATLRE